MRSRLSHYIVATVFGLFWTMAWADASFETFYAESKWGDVTLSTEKCSYGPSGYEAFIASAKGSPDMSAAGCWEYKAGYIYYNWTRSIGRNGSILAIDELERTTAPSTVKSYFTKVQTSKPSVELADFIISLMMPKGSPLSWPISGSGAGPTYQKYVTLRTPKNTRCGLYEKCRTGTVAIQIDGESTLNGNHGAPVSSWEFTLLSQRPNEKYPNELQLEPDCDSLQCEFEFLKTLHSHEIQIQKLCSAGPEGYRTTTFLLKKDNRQIYAEYTKGQGTGGWADSLSFRWRTEDFPEDSCTRANKME